MSLITQQELDSYTEMPLWVERAAKKGEKAIKKVDARKPVVIQTRINGVTTTKMVVNDTPSTFQTAKPCLDL